MPLEGGETRTVASHPRDCGVGLKDYIRPFLFRILGTSLPSHPRFPNIAMDTELTFDLEKRKAEAERIRQKYPDRIPVSHNIALAWGS